VPCAQKTCGRNVKEEFCDKNLSPDEHKISMVHLCPHHAERHRREDNDLSTCGSKAVVKFPFEYVEINCQLDATEVFIADIACSTCFGHHYAHHQELKSIIQQAIRSAIKTSVASSWQFISTY